ncbi:MAG: hypothetical protein ABL967_08685 [Bryobacteraceae bacterium]
MTPEPHERQAEPPGQVADGNRSSRWERLALITILAIFAAFTWRSLLSFYTGDDIMNSYWAWTWNHKSLVAANFLIWLPVYRPLGETIYLIFYALFGFAPAPFYTFGWLLLLANVIAAYAMFRALFHEKLAAFLALVLILVHGAYIDIYYNAGTIFDKLWFAFTVLGVNAYIRTRERNRISVARIGWIWLLFVLAMDSKEGGVTLLALFAAYECLFVLPRYLQQMRLRAWVRDIGPLYTLLTLTGAAFVFGRIMRTDVILETGAYHPQASASLWLSNVGAYLDMLGYRKDLLGGVGAAVLLIVLSAVALISRNRRMGFGLLWFAVTITPVALITQRPGYVLYVPAVGLGLYLGEVVASALRSWPLVAKPKASISIVAAIAVAVVVWNAANWPTVISGKKTAHFQLAHQFRREYPVLPGGAKLLFTSDYFAPDVWDMTMLLRLLYRDKTLDVRRLSGTPEMRPPKGASLRFDHVFATAGSHYEELDNRDIAESTRLHILRNFTVGRAVFFRRPDHPAYVVSGVKDYDGPEEGRWTEPKAILKFDVYPVASLLTVRYWVAPLVAEGVAKTLTIRVNGNVVGSAPLSEAGDMILHLPVKASQISATGFTLVSFDVDHPYKDASGEEFGIILFDVGFDHVRH